LRDDAEAEDTVQQVHLAAFLHLEQFEGRASYATWITRIAIREAIGRRASVRRRLDHATAELELAERPVASELETYRLVLMLREVERLSTTETAESIGVSEDNVRVRLHRARVLLREALWQQIGSSGDEAFSFAGERCARTVARVMCEIESVRRLACD
jgi:RNA polymerase sigma-70 factor (ECF subfamily)